MCELDWLGMRLLGRLNRAGTALLTTDTDDGSDLIAVNVRDSYWTWPRIEKSHINNSQLLLIGIDVLLIQKIACFPGDNVSAWLEFHRSILKI